MEKVPDGPRAQVRPRERLGYEADIDHGPAGRLLDACDRERHAVERDRTLVDRVATEVSRQQQPHPPLACGRKTDDLREPVDMAEHDMAAEEGVRRRGMLEVHPVAHAQAPERRHREGLRDHVEGERRLSRDVRGGDGQAASIDRDRRPEVGAVVPALERKDESGGVGTRFDGADGAEGLNEACEHAARIPPPESTRAAARASGLGSAYEHERPFRASPALDASAPKGRYSPPRPNRSMELPPRCS